METGARRGAGGMRTVAILSLPLLLVACESREPVSICAAIGDPEVEVTAASHDLSGARAVLSWDAASGQSRIASDVLEAPLLDQLWRMAETTMHALPDTEPSPCGLDTLSAVQVTFSDGSTMTRVTSCTGNALSRVANEVFEATDTEVALEGATGQATDPLSGILDACERLQ